MRFLRMPTASHCDRTAAGPTVNEDSGRTQCRMTRRAELALLIRLGLFASLLALVAPCTVYAGAAPQRVHVTAGQPYEFSFTLSRNVVARGRVLFLVKNAGRLRHRLKVCSTRGFLTHNYCTGTETNWISPGATAILSVSFKKKGVYEYLCAVRGHAAAGMKGALIVR